MKTKALLLTVVLSSLSISPVYACDGTGKYIGELFWTTFNFCPRGSAQANGNILPVSQHNALFSLMGTTYGGDGRTTFALPDLRGRAQIGYGTGPGLTPKVWGERVGAENATLTKQNLPSHSHTISVSGPSGDGTMYATPEPANTSNPIDSVLADSQRAAIYRTVDETEDIKDMALPKEAGDGLTATASNTGGSQSFSIQSPALAMTPCVCTTGIFPSRN